MNKNPTENFIINYQDKNANFKIGKMEEEFIIEQGAIDFRNRTLALYIMNLNPDQIRELLLAEISQNFDV